MLDAGPDACSLSCGTVNFGDEVFANPWPFIRQLYARTKELGVVPEFELFDMGQVATLHRLLGMEDTISFARGRPVTGNAELVERAAALAGLAQRPAMTPDQARAMLGVSGARKPGRW